MRVAFVTSSYPSRSSDPRGNHVRNMAAAIREAGATVTVYSPVEGVRPFHLDGITVRPVAYGVGRRGGRLATGISGIVTNLQARPWLALEVPGLVKGLRAAFEAAQQDHDLVHVHWLIPTAWAVGKLAAVERPFIITAHGGDVNLLRRLPFRSPRITRVFDNAAALTGVSEDIVEWMLENGADSKKTTLLPLGVPTQSPRKITDTGSFTFLFVGGLSARKSVETAIHAFSMLPDDSGTRFIVAGDGPRLGSLRELAKKSGRDRNIEFLGEVPPATITQLLGETDVLVLPSRSEGRPLVVMEAMARALPVLATDIPGTRELVQHRTTGILVPVGDAQALAEAMEEVSENRGWSRSLGRSGHERLASLRLDLEGMGDRLMTLYEGVLRGSPNVP